MKLEGIGMMDLEHQAEWAAAFLRLTCNVDDGQLDEWEFCTGPTGCRRAKFTFRGVSDEWLCGFAEAWRARFPNDDVEADHAVPQRAFVQLPKSLPPAVAKKMVEDMLKASAARRRAREVAGSGSFLV